MHSDPEVMRYLGGVLTREEAEQVLFEIMEIEAETGLVRFAIEQTGAPGLVGYCGLKPAGQFVDLSYMIGRKHWRQGFALEAAMRVRDFGLNDLAITNMEAGGAADNVGSIRILEQLSFKHRQELIFNGRPAIRFFD